MRISRRTRNALCIGATAVLFVGCATPATVQPMAPAIAAARHSMKKLPPFDVYVVINGAGLVDEYTSTGKLVRSFSDSGFYGPNDDAYDSKNKLLYVDDGDEYPISEFTKKGTYEGEFSDPGEDTEEITYDAPDDCLFLQANGLFKLTSSGKVLAENTTYANYSLAFDPTDKIVFTVINPGSSSEVAFYDTNLNYLGSASIPDNDGLLLWNTENKLLYAMSANNTMYAYQVDFKTLTLTPVSLSGSFSGLDFPRILANDKDGDVIISDEYGGHVQAYDSEGNFISTIAGDLADPWGIAIVPKH